MNNEIYIGDNYEVLNGNSLKKYSNKIKMIYIDPPYNTKNNKSYKDKITSEDWVDFIEKRINSSKYLLREDGVIFISIDDNEYSNLKLVCDKVFGKDNFVGTFITKQAQRSNSKYINTVHEYILCFAKNKTKLKGFQINRMEIPEDRDMINELHREVKKILIEEGFETANKKLKNIIKRYCSKYNIKWLKNYSNIDINGNIFFAVDLSTPGESRSVKIESIGLELRPLKTRGWSSDEKFIKLFNEDRLCFKDGRPYAKHFLFESKDNVPSVLNYYSRQGINDLKKLGIDGIFDTPKPVDLLKFLIRISTDSDDIVLDYFAGSGTLAQAVYEINCENERNNKYILIQSKEMVNESNNVYNVCNDLNINPSVDEILKYRIRTYLKRNNKEEDFNVYYI